MTIRTTMVLAILAFLSGSGGLAKAAVVYDNGAPTLTNGTEMTGWIATEDFAIAAGATVNSVKFWNFAPVDSYYGSIHWLIYSDSSGLPGSVLDEGDATPLRVNTGNTIIGLDEIENSFPIPAFTALPGITYHLGLHNGPLTEQVPIIFYWETTVANSTSPGLDNGAPFLGIWQNNHLQHAFQLLSVPEPSSVALAWMGAFGLAAWSWRRRKP